LLLLLLLLAAVVMWIFRAVTRQACANTGQWDRALAVFAGAKSEGIQPGQLG